MTSITNDFVPSMRAARVAAERGRVRPVRDGDIEELQNLLVRSGARNADAAPLRRLLFDSPWADSDIPSLVYEDRRERLLGFLGVTVRPMVFRERPIRAAVGHKLLLDVSRAGARAAIELVRSFFSGRQDLSLAVWDDVGCRIWTSLGGSVTPLHTLAWTRALRPARYIVGLLQRQGFAGSAARTLQPACQAVDAALNLFSRRAKRARNSSTLADDLDVVTMLSCLASFVRGRSLKPHYDIPSLAWVLDTIDQNSSFGDLYKVAVRTQSGRLLGWYVYSINAFHCAEVFQVGGKDTVLCEVLNHLFDHARQRGAVAVTGPMDASLVAALSDAHCSFHRPRNSWALIHSRDPRIAQAIHSGDAFLSRLENLSWLAQESAGPSA